jgi:succinyl-CoA synthetase beta subunit
MKIHEYQAKELLRAHGVPVPRGYPAFTRARSPGSCAEAGGSVWVVKAQIHAGGRGKGGGVKLARTQRRGVKDLAGQILGMQLKTHQTGPEGQKVRRLYIEEGADIQKEYYVSARDRPRHAEGGLHRQQPKAAWTSRKWRTDAREDHHRGHRPADRPG